MDMPRNSEPVQVALARLSQAQRAKREAEKSLKQAMADVQLILKHLPEGSAIGELLASHAETTARVEGATGRSPRQLRIMEWLEWDSSLSARICCPECDSIVHLYQVDFPVDDEDLPELERGHESAYLWFECEGGHTFRVMVTNNSGWEHIDLHKDEAAPGAFSHIGSEVEEDSE